MLPNQDEDTLNLSASRTSKQQSEKSGGCCSWFFSGGCYGWLLWTSSLLKLNRGMLGAKREDNNLVGIFIYNIIVLWILWQSLEHCIQKRKGRLRLLEFCFLSYLIKNFAFLVRKETPEEGNRAENGFEKMFKSIWSWKAVFVCGFHRKLDSMKKYRME